MGAVVLNISYPAHLICDQISSESIFFKTI